MYVELEINYLYLFFHGTFSFASSILYLSYSEEQPFYTHTVRDSTCFVVMLSYFTQHSHEHECRFAETIPIRLQAIMNSVGPLRPSHLLHEPQFNSLDSTSPNSACKQLLDVTSSHVTSSHPIMSHLDVITSDNMTNSTTSCTQSIYSNATACLMDEANNSNSNNTTSNNSSLAHHLNLDLIKKDLIGHSPQNHQQQIETKDMVAMNNVKGGEKFDGFST